MRIDRLTLANFKCFEEQTFDLHEHFTLFVGDNGSGNETLTDLRRSTIKGELAGIKLKDARRSLRYLRDEAKRLDSGQDVRLAPFCFAVEQAAGAGDQ